MSRPWTDPPKSLSPSGSSGPSGRPARRRDQYQIHKSRSRLRPGSAGRGRPLLFRLRSEKPSGLGEHIYLAGSGDRDAVTSYHPPDSRSSSNPTGGGGTWCLSPAGRRRRVSGCARSGLHPDHHRIRGLGRHAVFSSAHASTPGSYPRVWPFALITPELAEAGVVQRLPVFLVFLGTMPCSRRTRSPSQRLPRSRPTVQGFSTGSPRRMGGMR